MFFLKFEKGRDLDFFYFKYFLGFMFNFLKMIVLLFESFCDKLQ